MNVVRFAAPFIIGAGALACERGPSSAAKQAASVDTAAVDTAAMIGPYDQIGEADPTAPACRMSGSGADVCQGYVADANQTPEQRGQWLSALPNDMWVSDGQTLERESDGGAGVSKVTLSRNIHASSIALKAVGAGEIALARIHHDPSTPVEKHLKIGDNGFEDDYFLVASNFKNGAGNPPGKKPFIDWAIYGIEKRSGKAKRINVGAGTRLRFCEKRHPNRHPRGIYFATCERLPDVDKISITRANGEKVSGMALLDLVAHRTASLRASGKAVTLDIFTADAELSKLTLDHGAKEILLAASQDLFSGPLWLTCGIGCCVTE